MSPHDAASVNALSRLEFRQWAEFGTEAYGKTPWFFLRELAQNSRDAGARSIRVQAERDARDREVLVFADDGTGMTFDHARRYLFRLYSSSKEGDANAAGMYGIGFWTVLHFNPDEIRIESRTAGEKWGVAMSRDLEIAGHPCSLEGSGTRITLIRRPANACGDDFVGQVRGQLRHYCRYLRRNTAKPTPLPVFLGEEAIHEPLALPGLLSLTFRQGAVEGVVGVGPKPRVSLYAKGLPIWEGSFLDELVAAGANPETELGAGAYPVFLLNGNDLRSNLFRRRALDGNTLKGVIAAARRFLKQLIVQYSRQAFPRRGIVGWWDRAVPPVKQAARFMANPLRILAFLLFFLAGAGLLMISWPSSRRPATSLSLDPDQKILTGLAAPGQAQPLTLKMSYVPADDVLFNVLTADAFDHASGFFRSERFRSAERAGVLPCAAEGYSVTLEATGGDRIVLPWPTGQRIDPDSVAVRAWGKDLPAVRLAGDTLFMPAEAVSVSYRCCPDAVAALTAADAAWLTLLPEETVPQLDRLLPETAAPSRTVAESKELAAAIVSRQFFYDRSPKTVQRYLSLGSSQNWLSRVLTVGGGDCDMLNGVAVLLLRRQGVPSRLAFGLAGAKGLVSGEPHAWCEYFDNGWKALDVSGSCRLLLPPGAAGGTEAEASGAPPLRFLLILALTLLAVAAAFLCRRFFLKKTWSVQAGGLAAAGTDKIREELGQIALYMLQRPQAWGWDSRLWSQRFLPLSDGRLLSMGEALRLAKGSRLFLARPRNALASGLPRRRVRVLAAADPAFAYLYRAFPGVVDLDWIAGLNTVAPAKVPADPLAGILADLNRLLARVSRYVPQVLLAPGLADQDWQHIQVHPFTRRRRLPPAFVAVNPASPVLLPLAGLHRRNRRLAVFRAFCLLFTARDLALLPAGVPGKLAKLLLREEA